jgi:hypothetical protein
MATPLVLARRLPSTAAALTCPISAVPPTAPLRRVLVPDAIVGPTGLLATTWGSVSDVIGLVR